MLAFLLLSAAILFNAAIISTRASFSLLKGYLLWYKVRCLKGSQCYAGCSRWLSVEMPWLALGGPILALFLQMGLENTALTL